MLILLKVHTNNLNIRDFRFKTYSGAFLQAEYTENLGYLMVFFQKIGKITVFHTKLYSSSNIKGRKIQKIGFFGKIGTKSKSFLLQIIAKVTIIVEYTENSQNSRLYTIDKNTKQSSEKFSHIVSKIWHFLKCHNNCYSIKHKLLTHKNLKGAINCSYAYCEEDYGKCYKHAPFFSKHTIVSTGVTNAKITKTTKTYRYYKLQHKQI